MTITVDLREMGRRLSGIARLKHSSLPAHPDVKNVGIFYLVLKEGDLKLEDPNSVAVIKPDKYQGEEKTLP